jgi:hypothetical protein
MEEVCDWDMTLNLKILPTLSSDRLAIRALSVPIFLCQDRDVVPTSRFFARAQTIGLLAELPLYFRHCCILCNLTRFNHLMVYRIWQILL